MPEEVRGSESLAVIKTFSDLAKRTVHAEKMVGTDKIAVPKADATPEDIAAFQKAIGAAVPSLATPAVADDYKFEVPEGMEAEYTDDRLKSSREMAHEIKATQAQYERFMQLDAKQAAEIKAADALEKDRLHDENVLALKKEYGEAYDERIHIVKRLIAERFGSDETSRLAFLEEFAGNPNFVRFAAVIGARMVESKGLIAELTQTTPHESIQKINELRATPGYMSMASDMTSEKRTEITNQIREQHLIAYPEQKK